MENSKGICSICANDRHCNFPRKFPVWQCEEYTNSGTRIKSAQKNTVAAKIKE